jgi:hypothetical protein
MRRTAKRAASQSADRPVRRETPMAMERRYATATAIGVWSILAASG